MQQERKTKNANCVDLDGDTMALLLEHRTRCEIEAERRQVNIDVLLLFGKPGDVTRPWNPNWVTKRFALTLDYAGVAHFRLHDYADVGVMPMLVA